MRDLIKTCQFQREAQLKNRILGCNMNKWRIDMEAPLSRIAEKMVRILFEKDSLFVNNKMMHAPERKFHFQYI
jgi:hypothetical protein